MPAYKGAPIRLRAATLVFAIFVGATLFGPELLSRIYVGGARIDGLLLSTVHIALWLSGAYLVVRLLNQVLWERFVARVIERPVPRLLKDSLGLVVFLLAAAGIVGVEFGQPIVGIWATSGAIGIILGIALRDIILDIFTGLAVNFDHSYRIGDWVELIVTGMPVIRGKVTEINWRTTRIQTAEKRVIVVPNSRMGEMIVANLSMPDDIIRFETRIVLDFVVPTARALRVMSAGAKACCGPGGPLPEPEPQVLVVGVSELGVEYRVQHWQRVDSIGEAPARDAVMRSVLRHLAMAGLSPALPKFDTKTPTRQLDHYAIGDRAKLLRQLEIFDTLDGAQLERLGAETQPRHFGGGETLTVQGAPAGPMFVLAEGLCDVWLREQDTPRKLATIGPGDFVGERSMLTGEPHSTTVTAVTEGVAYAVHPEHLAPILADHPELYGQISHSVALRHLRFDQSLSAAADELSQPLEVHGIAAQIVDRMRDFFHTLGRNQVEPMPPEAAARQMSPP
jgi:small-conductance mechanosensitive channel/CRP-like cAMP-binding protein